MPQSATDPCAAVVGIDWAEATHEGCLQAAGAATREGVQRAHTPAALDAWVTTRRTRFNGQPVAVCLELNTGPLVFAWRQYALLLRFPLNPLTLARDREAFTPSRATDDPTEAERPRELRLTPRDKLPPLTPQSPARRALAPLVDHRRRVVGDNVRRTNRLTRPLKHEFPHGLQWFPANDPPLFCAFLRRGPPLKAAQLARRSPLETFFRAHQGRSAAVIAKRRHAINAASPWTIAAGVIAPHARLVQALGTPLRVTVEALETFETAIAQRAQRPPHCPLFQARPGAGPGFAARLLGAFGEQRHRDAAAAELQRYAGIAPVTERSGKKSWGHWRLHCPKCRRQTFVAWAAESTRHSCWAQV